MFRAAQSRENEEFNTWKPASLDDFFNTCPVKFYSIRPEFYLYQMESGLLPGTVFPASCGRLTRDLIQERLG